MTYGITGNTTKDGLWTPVAELAQWLGARGLPFRLHPAVAAGLQERGLVDAELAAAHTADELPAACDVLLSFGGDGTLLRSAHLVGTRGTPILGVNVGRLGFLAKVEVAGLRAAVEDIEAGAYAVEERMALAVEVEGAAPPLPRWALNDVVLDKSGTASMIAVEARVDGRLLNTYWADGLIVATPTGSTAYSLAAGGPIMAPGSGVVVLTPIAPHTLTARPLVLSERAVLQFRVTTRGHPFVLACDGESALVDAPDVTVTVRRAAHTVRLVTFAERDYFTTLREKLKWGQGAVFEVESAE